MEAITSKETASVLEDLIKINNDRIAGYEKALKDLKPEDSDLRMLFLKAIDQSRSIRTRLGTEIQTLGSSIPTDTSASGSIHRAWLDVKATFTGHGRKAILSSCEFGEDAIQKAYETALSSEHLPEYLSAVVLAEKQELMIVHNEIKALRDQSSD
ncbi:MAG TPA: PA2169 family four-helix-bundle protein [Puia sp.]|nr:PA2169 family four-helix-bundle protein [Puia sp.]